MRRLVVACLLVPAAASAAATTAGTTPAAGARAKADPKLQIVAKGLLRTPRGFSSPKGRRAAVRLYARRDVTPKSTAQLERLAGRYAPYEVVLRVGGQRLVLVASSSQLPRNFSWLFGSLRDLTEAEVAALGAATVTYRNATGRHTLKVRFPKPG